MSSMEEVKRTDGTTTLLGMKHHLEQGGVGLSRADLKGLDLAGVDFSGANLSYADLRDANLNGCNFQGANLFETNFNGSNLDSANFAAAACVLTKFRNCSIEDSEFRGRGDVYTWTTYSDGTETEPELDPESSRKFSVPGAVLWGCDFSKSNLRSSRIAKRESLVPIIYISPNKETKLFGLVTVKKTHKCEQDSEPADVRFCNFGGCDFTNSVFESSKIGFSNFENAVFETSNLVFANFAYCNFSNSKIHDSNFQNSALIECTFDDADIFNSNFENVSHCTATSMSSEFVWSGTNHVVEKQQLNHESNVIGDKNLLQLFMNGNDWRSKVSALYTGPRQLKKMFDSFFSGNRLTRDCVFSLLFVLAMSESANSLFGRGLPTLDHIYPRFNFSSCISEQIHARSDMLDTDIKLLNKFFEREYEHQSVSIFKKFAAHIPNTLHGEYWSVPSA